MAHSDRFSGAPMASSTWLRRTLPEEQAEPAVTITPARSSAITWVEAGTPGMAMQSVLERRGTPEANDHRIGRDCVEPGLGAIAQPGDADVIGKT